MTRAFAVRLKMHGPITVQYPTLSTAGGSYMLPPPSTLIGALYFAHTARNGVYKEVEEFNNDECSPAYGWVKNGVVLDAVAIPVGKMAMTNTLLRLFNWTRSTKENPYTVGYMGLSYITELVAIYAVRDDMFNELKRSAWGIVRLGKKEGLVSVLEVSDVEVIAGTQERLIVNSYFPKDVASLMQYKYDIFMFPDPSSKNTYCGGKPAIKEYVFSEDGVEVGEINPNYKVVKYGDKYAILRW
ncbi:type I-A CRISPR-associated protein Cas5a [Vulcanisaeta distributa]|uniref:CRISPR-associated protein Cas5 family n=1 Tax=Vulcanisaeta distributa (strain DSM 14429 / JCM 11212 / NBRC 100878 / IC-017) TaxID=572478 RepID=E1QU72_VULDI|nr:type I-A CRISPR-associated protein Cas5a [Vulcanisaeta distributa]ADN51066.1 CRISPR-associated protein Cas5 family [Vulcanisaeta distributa DSM 14429]